MPITQGQGDMRVTRISAHKNMATNTPYQNLEKNLAHFLSTQNALLLQMINRTEDEDIGMLRSSLIFFVQAASS